MRPSTSLIEATVALLSLSSVVSASFPAQTLDFLPARTVAPVPRAESSVTNKDEASTTAKAETSVTSEASAVTSDKTDKEKTDKDKTDKDKKESATATEKTDKDNKESATETETDKKGDKTKTDDKDEKTKTDDKNDKDKDKDKNRTTGNLNTGHEPTGTATNSHTKSLNISENAPPGTASMIKPALTDGTQLYKIGDFVTMQWNYTSLQATPTGVDVLAVCTPGDGRQAATYTITHNMTFSETPSLTWDTGKYQKTATDQLVVAEYTLHIFDTDGSPTEVAEPGHLMPYRNTFFGMYTKQPYVSIDDGWTCAICSGSFSEGERRAMGFVVGTAIVTVLSFTWFVTGLNVL